MTQDEIFCIVAEIIGRLVDRPKIVVAMTTKVAAIEGWDSMRQVMFVVAIEERFGVRLRNQEIGQLKSVGDAVKIIGDKQKVLF